MSGGQWTPPEGVEVEIIRAAPGVTVAGRSEIVMTTNRPQGMTLRELWAFVESAQAADVPLDTPVVVRTTWRAGIRRLRARWGREGGS